MAKKYENGLALSGGAARGLAHLGVVKALYEKGIKPGVISGTSAGSIAGAFLADGHDPEKMLDIFLEKKLYQFLGLTFGKLGLLKISGIRDVLKKHLKAKKFEDLEIPLYVACTNMNSGEVEYFSECDLFIEPEELRKYGLLDVGMGKKMFEIGYKDAMKKLEKNKVFK